MLWIKPEDTAGLSEDQRNAVENIGSSPWLVQPLSAPAGAGKTTSMRALVSASHRKFDGETVVIAPTGKAVDVAVWEGAGDRGYTVAKALQLLHTNELELSPATLVIVDEAGMVGTDDLRQLLTATTSPGAKAVLVGDEHQLAPVKARGGMFAQLCRDLPWTQRLSEVWRMRDPDERAASLGVREGNAAQVRAAVDWYRNHDRLRSGDDVVMAADALDGYRFDVAAGKDALLVCSTTETADALNHRLHHEHRSGHSEAVTGVRDHRIGVGDLILTRANDPTIALQNADKTPIQDRPVRNGHRWRVAAIDPATNRLAAERVDDSARAVFDSDYVKDSISLGYAVTVHSAQGVTADTTHAVLSENTTRSLLYVAVTRGRESNTIYLCERVSESEYVAAQTDTAATVCDTGGQAAAKLITIALQKDDRPSTALDLAQQAPTEALPGRVTALRDYTAKQLADLRQIYRGQHTASTQSRRAPDQSRGRSLDSGIEL